VGGECLTSLVQSCTMPTRSYSKCVHRLHEFEYRHQLPGSYLTCYATSKDGYSWHKPELESLNGRGARKNNFIGVGHDSVAGMTVVEAPPVQGHLTVTLPSIWISAGSTSSTPMTA